VSRRDVPRACFETRAFRALLSMRRLVYAMHYVLILRSGPEDRVSKDAQSDLQARCVC
jgi:hypothetical protein